MSDETNKYGNPIVDRRLKKGQKVRVRITGRKAGVRSTGRSHEDQLLEAADHLRQWSREDRYVIILLAAGRKMTEAKEIVKTIFSAIEKAEDQLEAVQKAAAGQWKMRETIEA